MNCKVCGGRAVIARVSIKIEALNLAAWPADLLPMAAADSLEGGLCAKCIRIAMEVGQEGMLRAGADLVFEEDADDGDGFYDAAEIDKLIDGEDLETVDEEVDALVDKIEAGFGQQKKTTVAEWIGRGRRLQQMGIHPVTETEKKVLKFIHLEDKLRVRRSEELETEIEGIRAELEAHREAQRNAFRSTLN